ncbi:hypothetical protein [Terricaulis silvestris]|uniref:Uncharacterized protein n=1 Tax=Terricaulis silvestris TaxID=2686094 RepID=A0A6I6MMK2_9CAUL|nr:hypothetical protein [Terricaulis silvestris]QGZ94568.1 hypothetical protein DSM104635_01387 [Terricaulis silvestris]
MRMMLAAAVAAIALATPASAGPWSDEASHLAFVAPDGWNVRQLPAEGMTYILADAGSKECHILASQRPETAEISPERIRAGGETPIGNPAWAQIPGALPTVFAADAAVTQSSVDTSAFWPVQRADYNSQGQVVHAAIQFRPGVEFWGFCFSRTGADDAATYEGVLRSIAGTTDAELQANIDDRRRGRRRDQEARDAGSRSAMDEAMRNTLQDRAMEAVGRSQ